MHGRYAGLSSDSRPTVFVCDDSDCASKLTKRLCQLLESAAEVEKVDCQKICHGPVVGMRIDDELVWFEKVETRKAENALLSQLTREAQPLESSLRKRLVAKRSGKLRG